MRRFTIAMLALPLYAALTHFVDTSQWQTSVEAPQRVLSASTLGPVPVASHDDAMASLETQAAEEEAARVAREAEAAALIQAAEQARVRVIPRGPWPTPSEEWWDRIAQCETGSRWDWHGSIYSTAYGIINAAIHQQAPPDSAARILAGTATKEEQLFVARAVYAYAGPSAWGCTKTVGWPG